MRGQRTEGIEKGLFVFRVECGVAPGPGAGERGRRVHHLGGVVGCVVRGAWVRGCVGVGAAGARARQPGNQGEWRAGKLTHEGAKPRTPPGGCAGLRWASTSSTEPVLPLAPKPRRLVCPPPPLVSCCLSLPPSFPCSGRLGFVLRPCRRFHCVGAPAAMCVCVCVLDPDSLRLASTQVWRLFDLSGIDIAIRTLGSRGDNLLAGKKKRIRATK